MGDKKRHGFRSLLLLLLTLGAAWVVWKSRMPAADPAPTASRPKPAPAPAPSPPVDADTIVLDLDEAEKALDIDATDKEQFEPVRLRPVEDPEPEPAPTSTPPPSESVEPIEPVEDDTALDDLDGSGDAETRDPESEPIVESIADTSELTQADDAPAEPPLPEPDAKPAPGHEPKPTAKSTKTKRKSSTSTRPVEGDVSAPAEVDAPAPAPAATTEDTLPEADEPGVPAPVEPETPQAWVQPVDGECPEGFPVKARYATGHFHEPGDRGYDKIIPDCCYPTKEAAEADGFTASRWS
jgi:hypothetical protein